MTRHLTVNDEINEQLQRLRIKYSSNEEQPASYSYVIKKALKKAKMWKHQWNKINWQWRLGTDNLNSNLKMFQEAMFKHLVSWIDKESLKFKF